MRISVQQFLRLQGNYIAHRFGNLNRENMLAQQERFAHGLQEAIEYIEQHVSSELLDINAITSDDTSTLLEQKSKIDLLFSFFDNILELPSQGPVRFNRYYASAAKAWILDPKLSELDHLYFYESPQHLGIREKYSHGTLTSQHALTDVDMRRILEITETKDRIHIGSFTKEGLETLLSQARNHHAKSNEQYILPLLLKVPSSDKSPAHWIAVKIMVDPLKHTVRYEINDSQTLSAQQKTEFKKLIEDSLKSKEGMHRAFDDFQTLSEAPHSIIQGSQTKHNAYTSGYYAIHHLLQTPEVCGNNPKATDLAKVNASDAKNLINTVFRYQLQDFSIPIRHYEVLGERQREAFKKPNKTAPTAVRVNEEKLNQFLAQIPTTVPIMAPAETHPDVQESIGEYNPDLRLMRFPRKNVSHLAGADYLSFLELLAEKLQGKASPLPKLSFTQCNIDALDGLNAFFSVQPVTLFSELSLKIDLQNPQDIEPFLGKLKLSLSNLSRANVQTLSLVDEHGLITEAHLKDLIDFIKKNRISCSLELPDKFQKSRYQNQIDEIIDVNRQEKNAAALSAQHPAADVLNKKNKVPRPPRKKLDLRQAMKVDVELQEGMEETPTSERSSKTKQAETQYTELVVHTFKTLQDAVNNKNFSSFAKASGGMKKVELINYWHTLFGNVVKNEINLNANQRINQIAGQIIGANKELHGITDAALSRLVEYKHYFQQGLNLRQLPQGFLLIPDPQKPTLRVLHFDHHLVHQNTIAPVLINAEKPTISISAANRMVQQLSNPQLVALWDKINKQEPYVREHSQIFRKHLLDLLKLSPEQIIVVMALCGTMEHFDYNTFDLIFTNLPKLRNMGSDPSPTDDFVSLNWLNTMFKDNAESIKQYYQLAHQHPIPVEKHPLQTWLHDEDKARLNTAIKEFNLTQNELDGLLGIYDKYGLVGLQKIISYWDELKTIPKIQSEQIRSIPRDVSSYENILAHPQRLMDAVNTISGLSKAEKQWWDTLYKAHQPMPDNFPNLVDSFKTFKKAVEEMGLSFYDLDPTKPTFIHAGNLPTTLGRMLSILNLCADKDRKQQWEVITKIDLSPQGAIRALTDWVGTDKACGFVLPEMAIGNVAEYHLENGYNILNDINLVKGITNIAHDRPEDATQVFYRYLAHQKYRMPLAFYQQAFRLLEAKRAQKLLPDSVIIDLCILLLASSTGNNYRFFIQGQQTTETEWQSIINNIAEISITGVTARVQTDATKLLLGIPQTPPLPVLAKLVALVSAPLKNVGIFDIKHLATEIMPKFQRANTQLIEYIQAYDSKVYHGMKFQTQADFNRSYPENRNLFDETLERIRIL